MLKDCAHKQMWWLSGDDTVTETPRLRAEKTGESETCEWLAACLGQNEGKSKTSSKET